MSNGKQAATIAITGLLALGILGTAQSALAQAAKPTYKFEKCFGVAKAGLNDCQTATHLLRRHLSR